MNLKKSNISDKIQECLELLAAGKKVKWNQNYVYYDCPIIKVVGVSGATSEPLELECVSTKKFESYDLSPTMLARDVKVVGYSTSNSCPILYVTSNPQMNRTMAHLENGDCVDYDLGLIDFWHAYGGEYIEPMNRVVKLTIFKRYDGDYHRKFYAEDTLEVPDDVTSVYELNDWIRQTYDRFSEMDVIVDTSTFGDGFPLCIVAEERKNLVNHNKNLDN